ncbi:HpcH/HpaI aldolase family protein [Arthrobacter sp. AD-310]
MKWDSRGGRPPALLHQAIPSLSVTEWALAAGYDGVVVDLQHGEVGLEAACTMLRATPRDSAYSYARVGSLDSAPILRLLDSGARGIIAPTIESGEQARMLVEATKYPGVGNRSLGPSRPALYEGESYTEAGNRAVSTIAQIETVAGLKNAEEIVTTPGLDSIYIGPADLAVSFGLPGRGDWEDGPVHEAIVQLSVLTRKRGVTLGIYSGSSTYAADLLDRELVDYVGLGIDLVFLSRAAQESIKTLRGTE